MKAVAKRDKFRSTDLIARIQRRVYACKADAETALEEVRKTQHFATCTIKGAIQERSVLIKRSKRGRPKQAPIRNAACQQSASPSELWERADGLPSSIRGSSEKAKGSPAKRTRQPC